MGSDTFWNVVKMYRDEGMERKEIAYRLGVSYKHVAYVVSRAEMYGILEKRNQSTHTPPDVRARVLELYQDFLSIQPIVRATGVPLSTCYYLITGAIKAGELEAPMPSRKRGNRRSIDVRRANSLKNKRVVEMYKSGMSQRAIADHFGYKSHRSITYILNHMGVPLRDRSEVGKLTRASGRYPLSRDVDGHSEPAVQG